jgi:hypothetical protein
MKKLNMLVMLALTSFLGFAQIEQVSYRGAFAPSPTPMWTNGWTNFDPQNTTYSKPTTVNVDTAITTNTTWDANVLYKLQGIIYVKNGATLTIPAGTIIEGDHTFTGSALVITKGSKLMAIGTAAKPIVFTSDVAAGSRNKGDWGGLILLGKSNFNINGGVNYIEGIAQTADTQYGGGTTPDENDSSGYLRYVRIEFPGYVYAPNNEINGLTLGAVGKGTVIDYVQVSHSNDDSFEWFGGSVDCKHLVAFRGLDDDFDTDNGYNGKVQFGLGIRDPHVSDDPAISTSEGFESDNNATGSSVNPYTSAIFTNFTMIGPMYRKDQTGAESFATGYKRAARIRRASQLKIMNSVFLDYNEGVHVDGNASETAALNGTLKFANNILAGTVTTSKITQVNTTGNNASFNIATWYAASGNTTLTDNSGLLATPYGTTSTQYTGLDYRPATNSPLLNSAVFSDPIFSTTSLAGTACNSTLSSLNFQINAIPLNGATGYRFEVTNGTTNEVNVLEYNSAAGYAMRLTSLPSGGYFGTTYSIRVSVKSSLGVWGDYGSTCTVTSPAAPASTKVNAGQCGTTVSTLNTAIFADTVIGVNAYKFEVKQNGNVIAEITNTSYFFNIGNIPGVTYGQTYSIKVAVRYNGNVWSSYANRTCDVSTPAASPLTTIANNQCGTTIAAKDTVIYAAPVLGVTSYRFEISLGGSVLAEYTNNTSYYFRLTQALGSVAFNSTYSVRVATLVNGVWGSYGAACTISTPPSLVNSRLYTYPNPFSDSFRIGGISATENETIEARIYDFNGMLIEQKLLNSTDANNSDFGANLKAGLYLVVLKQGEDTKTVQVMKN